MSELKNKSGKVYICSTPIGNKDDFTIRAMNSIKRCDFVICEELKIGARTLKSINLSKELIDLNEHNEVERTYEILERIRNGEKACLISDDGTPLIADPGSYFIKTCIKEDIRIEVVPGVTSIMTALVRSGMPTNEFLFAGFLNRKIDDKFSDVRNLSKERRTVVLLETPYRLISTLEVLSKIMPNRNAYIGMNLTYAYETHHYGTFEELYEKFKDNDSKSEFVICFEGADLATYGNDNDYEVRNDRNFESQRRSYRNSDSTFRRQGPRKTSGFSSKFGNRNENKQRRLDNYRERNFGKPSDRDNDFRNRGFEKSRDNEKDNFYRKRDSDSNRKPRFKSSDDKFGDRNKSRRSFSGDKSNDRSKRVGKIASNKFNDNRRSRKK